MAARRLVLDASAAVCIIEGLEAAKTLDSEVENADLVLPSSLMLTEVANALWRLQRSGQLAAETLPSLLEQAARLVDRLEPDHLLLSETLHWPGLPSQPSCLRLPLPVPGASRSRHLAHG